MTSSVLNALSKFSADTLKIDVHLETERITNSIRDQVHKTLRKRGLVLGLSGGIDSSLCAALAARALGSENVLCLFMPENDSDPESFRLSVLLAETLGLKSVTEDIGPALQTIGCYERRDAFIREIVPDYGPRWGCKIVIANPLEGKGYAISSLIVQSPDGRMQKLRMPPSVYLGIIAATNMKQRMRKHFEYFHADRLNFAVLGTPNRLEYDQGFFVKNGDGSADIKPIAHLYKSQVYQLAAHLGLPDEILRRPPTTDTWSLPQTQEEFYFALPYDLMDLCLYGLNHNLTPEQTAAATGLTVEQISQVWSDISAKRRATRYLHMEPLLVEPVDET